MDSRFRLLTACLLTVAVVALATTSAAAPAPSFEERVAAQSVIERVYHGHRLGETGAFSEVVTRDVLEAKVRAYLARSSLLERLRGRPVTAEQLERELERIARDTRFPRRLEEIRAALGHDTVLLRECFARPVLVERLLRQSLATDESLRLGSSGEKLHGRSHAAALHDAVPGLDQHESDIIAGPPCAGDDTWDGTRVEQDTPSARSEHTAVWTGSEMIVWGGREEDLPDPYQNTGGRYDPLTDQWTPTSTVNAPWRRTGHVAVWTGREMIVWGGYDGTGGATYLGTGGRYDPVTNTWAATTETGAPASRFRHVAVWTGSLLVVYGGRSGATYLHDGGRYDPIADAWQPLATVDAPEGSHAASAVWTGTEMIVWGGEPAVAAPEVNTGGRYDPDTDSWRPTATLGAPEAREFHAAVWAGTEMIVWGGRRSSVLLDTGGRYDPLTDAWMPTTLAGVPEARYLPTAVWTGANMIVWGGSVHSSPDELNSGGRYDPAADAWQPTSLSLAPSARADHTAVWSGLGMIVWGGSNGTVSFDSGGHYALHQSADLDEDGFDRCHDDDCDDLDDASYPGATELCDGLDNDCDGVVDDGVDPTPDTDGDGWYSCGGDCDDTEPGVRPGSFELCNFIDDDCDGSTDEGLDRDGDGFLPCDGDCDDGNDAAFPGATEFRNCADDDCDGTVDEGFPDPELDLDGDSYSPCGGDCDDDDELVYPGASVRCRVGGDADCDGSADGDTAACHSEVCVVITLGAPASDPALGFAGSSSCPTGSSLPRPVDVIWGELAAVASVSGEVGLGEVHPVDCGATVEGYLFDSLRPDLDTSDFMLARETGTATYGSSSTAEPRLAGSGDCP